MVDVEALIEGVVSIRHSFGESISGTGFPNHDRNPKQTAYGVLDALKEFFGLREA
jgi:hypothetical protein